MTAHAADDEAAACRSAGMDGHLSKPFDMPELCSLLQTWSREPDRRATVQFSPPSGVRS